MAKKKITCRNCGSEGSITSAGGQIVCAECGPVLPKTEKENKDVGRGSIKMTGRCRSFLKGWGFIVGYDGREYFAHQSSILMAGFRQLFPGQEVEFDVDIVDPRGPRAINIQPGPLPDNQEPKSFRDDVVNKEG